MRRGNEEIGADPAKLWCDATACADALARNDAEAVLELYRGKLLDGFHVADVAPEFDRWIDEADADLRARVMTCLITAAADAERNGDVQSAIALLQRSMAITSHDEHALRQLMALYHRHGQRASALRAYDEFAHRMAQDYDSSPSEETQNLAANVRREEMPGPVRALGLEEPPRLWPAAPRRRKPSLVMAGIALVMVFTAGWLVARATRAEPSRVAWHKTVGDNVQALTHHSAVAHPRRKHVYIYGGGAGGRIHGEVWRLVITEQSIANWDRVTPAGTAPAPRWGHAAVYDTISDRMIVFGGALGHSAPCSNDVWLLAHPDGWNASAEWLKLNVAPGPAPRADHSAAYDERTNRLIVFGGHDCIATRFNDVWILEHANGIGGTPAWRRLNVAFSPPRRSNHTSVYDAQTNRMILYGGANADHRVFGETWILHNANGSGDARWFKLRMRGAVPTPRLAHTAVYSPARSRMIVFGGALPKSCTNEVWILANANGMGVARWKRSTPTPPLPQGRCVHAASLDASDRMIVLGGEAAGVLFVDMWLLQHASGD